MNTTVLEDRKSLATRHHLTVEDFHKIGAAGILGEDDRVELIEGELIDMPPIESMHAGLVNYLVQWFGRAVGDEAIVAPQNPITLGSDSELQPDIALLRPRDDFYRRSHPHAEDALLLIEVAESSFDYDRNIKLPLYARHDIPEVWLIDLQRQCVEIYLEPTAAGYRHSVRPNDRESISPLLLPGMTLLIADLWR